MSRTPIGVRELAIRYKPLRVALPVNGDVGTPRAAAHLAAAVLAGLTVEQVIALHVNTKQKLIGVHVVSIGTLNASLVHPREVFKAALLTNAAGLFLATTIRPAIRRRALMTERSCLGFVRSATSSASSCLTR